MLLFYGVLGTLTLAFFWNLFSCERFLKTSQTCSRKVPPGLEQMLKRCTEELSREGERWFQAFEKGPPRLVLVASPFPFLFAVRAWRSRGTLLLSQAQLYQSHEFSLEQGLKEALKSLPFVKTIWHSFFLALTERLLTILPKEYRLAFYTQPASPFVIPRHLPWIRFLFFCFWFPWIEVSLRILHTFQKRASFSLWKNQG